MATPGRVSPSGPSSFSGPAAARIAGITYRRLDYWARQGYVRPTMKSSGRGKFRQYSAQDVIALRIAKQLRGKGISLRTIRQAVQMLDGGDSAAVLASYDLRVSGKKLVAVPQDGSPPIDLARGGQLMLGIGLELIGKAVRGKKGLAKAGRSRDHARLLDQVVFLKRGG